MNLALGVVIGTVLIALAALVLRIAVPESGVRRRLSVPLGPPPAANLQAVYALAPFGHAAPVAGGPTSLGMELRGVMLAEPMVASTVLIAPIGGRPMMYRAGDVIAGGARLETIARDHVLVRNGERIEVLAFAEGKGAASLPPSTEAVILPSPPPGISPAERAMQLKISPPAPGIGGG